MEPEEIEQTVFIDDRPTGCTCLSIINFFNNLFSRTSSPPSSRSAQINQISPQNSEMGKNSQSLLDLFPPLHTMFISYQLEQKTRFQELCENGQIIGFVGGKITELTEDSEIITISEELEIDDIATFRPFSLSHLFITNDFNEEKEQTLFSAQQIFSIKFAIVKEVSLIIQKWENFLKKTYTHTPLKNIFHKLFVKISIIQDSFWVTFNQDVEEDMLIKSSFWEKAHLSVDEDSELIAQLKQQISLEEFLSLTEEENIKCAKTKAEALIEKKLVEKKEKQKEDQSPISSVRKSSNEKSSLEQKVMKDKGNISESSSGLFYLLRKDSDEGQKNAFPLSRMYRSLSCEINEKEYKEEKSKKNENIEEELQNYYY